MNQWEFSLMLAQLVNWVLQNICKTFTWGKITFLDIVNSQGHPIYPYSWIIIFHCLPIQIIQEEYVGAQADLAPYCSQRETGILAYLSQKLRMSYYSSLSSLCPSVHSSVCASVKLFEWLLHCTLKPLSQFKSNIMWSLLRVVNKNLL